MQQFDGKISYVLEFKIRKHLRISMTEDLIDVVSKLVKGWLQKMGDEDEFGDNIKIYNVPQLLQMNLYIDESK